MIGAPPRNGGVARRRTRVVRSYIQLMRVLCSKRAVIALLGATVMAIGHAAPATAAVLAPTGVGATRGASNEVAVTWTASTGATDYLVKAYTTASGSATWDSCSTVTTSCDSADGLHVSRVREAWIEVTANDVSSSAAAARVKIDALPAAPTAPTLTARSEALTVDWTWAAAGTGVTPTGYAARAYSAALGGALLGTCTTNSAAVRTCSIVGLTNGTVEYVEVVATTAVDASTSISTQESEPSPRSAGTPFGTPTAPTSTLGAGGDSVIEVGWAGPTSDGGSSVTGYLAEAFTTSSGVSAIASCEPSTLSSMSCDITSLSNGTTYYVQVTARNTAGAGAASARFAAQPGTRSTAPRSVVVARGNGTLDVEWSKPSSDGGSAITTYVASAYSASYGGTAVGACISTTLSCTIGGVVNATTYYVSVVATTAVGTSQPSSRVTVRLSAAPTAPRSVSAVRGNGFALVSWSAPLSLNGSVIVKYIARAYRDRDGGEAMADCSPLESALRCNLGPLPNGSTYYVDVVAVTARFTSEPSSPRASVLTAAVPDVPREATAVQRGTGVDVRWVVPVADGGQSITRYVATAYASPSSTQSMGECSTAGDSCTIEELDGPPVYIDVVARNTVGASAPSAPRLKVVIGGLPREPRDIAARRLARQVHVTWTPPVDDGGSRIMFSQATVADTAGRTIGSCLGERPTDASRHACSIAVGGEKGPLRVAVSATNAYGSTQAPSIDVGGTALSSPRDLVVLPTENALVAFVSRALSDQPSTRYVFRTWSKQSGGRLMGTCTALVSLAQPACTLGDLANYQTVWVDAVELGGGRTSKPTERQSAVPMASAPSAPREMSMTSKAGDLVVRWQAPLTDGGYAITTTTVTASSQSTDGSTLGTCTAKALVTTCTIRGLEADYAYVTVQATTPVGVGAVSAPIGRNLSSSQSVVPRTIAMRVSGHEQG